MVILGDANMKKSTYQWIWKQIEESIKDVETQFSLEAKKRQNFQLTHGNNTKKTVKQQYVSVRDDFKMKCYAEKKGQDIRIDQHKIASCFCKALIQKKIFSFTIDEDIGKDMLLSNYELAYIVSLRIIYIYLIAYYIKTGQKQFADKLISQKNLKVPQTTRTHDGYNAGRIKTLALNDFYGIEFDILTYSDMMYWIEYYNRQLIEEKIEIEPDNPLEP